MNSSKTTALRAKPGVRRTVLAVPALTLALALVKDVDVAGPTRAIAEAAANPIMPQGDHGPVAFHNIYVRPLPPIIMR